MSDLAEEALNGTVLPVSVKDRERFTPEHYAARKVEKPPVYILAPMKWGERRLLNRLAMKSHGMFVSTTELREALQEAAALEWPDNADVPTTLRDLTEWEGVPERDESVELLMAAARTKVGRWQNDLSRLPGGQRLRDLLALQLEQLENISILGMRFCLRGWEELPGKFTRKGGMASDEAMQLIPDEDKDALATRCISLREVAANQE